MGRGQAVLQPEVVEREADLTNPVQDVWLRDACHDLSLADGIPDVDRHVADPSTRAGGDLQNAAAPQQDALAGHPGGNLTFEPPDDCRPHQQT